MIKIVKQLFKDKLSRRLFMSRMAQAGIGATVLNTFSSSLAAKTSVIQAGNKKFELPQPNELIAVAAELGYEMDKKAAESLLQYMVPFGQSYHYLDDHEDELLPIKYGGRSYEFPKDDENKLGAWYVRTKLPGKETGPLKGKRIAIKDNIFVAQVPMMNGANILEGFMPDFDATVVTRLLDAGAEIAGKSVCEYLCVSGGSATASSGIVHNPRNPAYSAGGSSSGSAALVGGGDVDMALGCDQAGSIRIPSSWCGTYGMKPTHGLVPYTGIIGMEMTLDQVGPITANVTDNALMLEVLAGYDGMDSRQRELKIHTYTNALGKHIKGLKIGVLQEGFAHPLSSPLVDECVREAAGSFSKLGAEVENVSIPMHPQGVSIWGGVISDGLWNTVRLNGLGYNMDGYYSPSYLKAMQGWQAKLDQVPPNVLLFLLLGKYLERYGNKYYAKAKNMVPRLRGAYDKALDRYDLLLLPTTLKQASKNPATQAELTTEQIMGDAFDTVLNTCQFDISGHPAMSVPCGVRNGLPVGMMLVAKHFDEPAIYRAAHAFEQSINWQEV